VSVCALGSEGGLGAVQVEGPWDRPGTLYFYGGKPSNFAETPGLWLPEAWYGHPVPCRWVLVPTLEHWFQACKAMSREDFYWVLDAPTPRQAKARGGRRGEGGRRIALRPDWEQVKFSVMRFGCLRKFALPGFRAWLLATGERVLVEDSPYDYVWGGRDRSGGYSGRNLLGIVLMAVRSELRAEPGRHGA
jgi:ribA/ribD-fused uncharacterized protein